ncbi:hypothetical protein GCM10020367_08250 [Streptomyces sannanensis]|uniref:HEAT repeat domain-containing protein n=1 Tax=Streptomyces sannanensis TaxID=285536 RepID=A0ABP6S5S1_9ACTN
MPSTTGLTDQREQWIQKIYTGIAATVGHHPVLDPARIVGEPSDLDLQRALLILRIAVLDARGWSTAHITGLLAEHPVFADPKPETDQLANLVKRVRWRVERDGLTDSVLLFGLGLRAEDPESTYALLLDHWSRRRAHAATAAQVARELTRHWGSEAPRAGQDLAPHSLAPLEAYSATIWSRLKEEPDARVQHAASLALLNRGNKAQDLWMKRFPAREARHLRELGAQAACCVAASAPRAGRALLLGPPHHRIVPP